MADTTPLISQGDDKHKPPPPPLPELLEKPPLNLDSAIEECIGEFGWAQLTQATLVSLSWFFDAQQTFISVFTDSQPSWHCTDSTCVNGSSDVCDFPTSSWAWDQGRHVSVVSEWSLQCATPFVRGLPASAFFIGCLAGGLLLATLADTTLGRRKMLLLSSLSMSASALFTAFTNSVWAYAALRFICGFGRATIGTCALVLSTELVGRKWRGTVGMVGFFGFSLGFLSLPAMAFANRGLSWRNLYLLTSVPSIFYCLLIYFFVHESPRYNYLISYKIIIIYYLCMKSMK